MINVFGQYSAVRSVLEQVARCVRSAFCFVVEMQK